MSVFFKNIRLLIATGFGAGYLPIAPGSWGSAMAVIAGWWLLDLSVVWYVVVVIAILCLGVWAVRFTELYFAIKTKSNHDNKHIVIDEWVGQLITLLPIFYFGKSLLIMTMGLFLFRALDTAKFGLAKYFDNHPSSWGVVFDDVFAGIHASVIFSLVLWICQQTTWLHFIF